MEPENIEWDNIDSTFVQDDAYEKFDAPKWVDLSSNELLDVDDEAWFCTYDCKHPKTAEDFLKPTITSNAKAKILRFASFSEMLPFRDRHRRQNSSAEESSYVKLSEKTRRPNCSGNSNEDSENKNPNFSAPKDRTTKPKKPLMRAEREIPKHLNGCSKEYPVKSDKKPPQLKSTFSAQNLLGGREILSQITGFCSELKWLAARKGYSKKGESEKSSSGSEVLEELKEEAVVKERVPLLVVKEGSTSTLKNGKYCKNKWQ